MPSIEARTEALWIAKQSALRTPVATAAKRARKVGGSIDVNRADANQNWSDGNRFATAEDYVDTLVGNGAPVVQGQAGVLAYLLYLMNGQETSVTAVAGPSGLWDHVGSPSNSGGFWFGAWTKVGETIVKREKFNDCRLSSLRIEGSSGQKTINATPTLVSLDPGEVYTSDPVQAEDADRSLNYVEGEGRFKINGALFRAHSSFAFTMNDAVAPWYGDAARPRDVSFGQATIDIEGVTILVDQQGKDYYDETIYGTTNPPAGTKPRTDLPIIGSYELELKRGTVIDVSIVGATAGTYTLTVDGQTTAGIPFNSTAAQVQAAVEALANVIPGDVVVSGGPHPGTAVRLVFGREGRVVTGTFTGLTGGANSATNRGHEKGAKFEFPGVKWSPDIALAGNPDGGATELALGAQVRKVAGSPIFQSTVRCADPAYS